MAVKQISRSQGIELKSNPGFVLRKDAGYAWDRACIAFGKQVLLTGAWRSYETQVELFDSELYPKTGRYVRGNHAGKPGFAYDVRGPYRGSYWTRKLGTAPAAVPGTSNHGGGVAVDVKTRRYTGDPGYDVAVIFAGWTDADRIRFLKVAAEHGWADDEGRSVSEHWHLTYYPSRDRHYGQKPSTKPSRPAKPRKRKPSRLPTIKRGSRSGWVPVIQRLVGTKDDGIFLDGTVRAVKAFQGRRGLPQTGVVDLRTWTMFLYGHALARGDRGDRVKVLQNMVGLTGKAADGIFLTQTHGRVVEVQRYLGIGVDGVAGREFRDGYLDHFNG